MRGTGSRRRCVIILQPHQTATANAISTSAKPIPRAARMGGLVGRLFFTFSANRVQSESGAPEMLPARQTYS